MAAATQFSFVVCLLAAMASLGKAQAANTTAANTTAATTTAATGGSTANPGSTATPGTGPTTTAGTGGSTAAPGTNAPATAAPTTQPPMIACLSCNGTGTSNDPCPDAPSGFATTKDCATQGGCWVSDTSTDCNNVSSHLISTFYLSENVSFYRKHVASIFHVLFLFELIRPKETC
ncbi:Hypp5124 [Branchiostoma lanceolatum]|uniref:Hypp5124 protein n=1 Tax=Branchiostoma lanceolatum TaxID=7740 RepID=A0A8K0AED5_BRALA|nr:Hypp5124 [Branchiostoma lanceolatum]